jgi:sigma-B regulation protein RsbU (phosphoserine phosphatase)
MRILEERPLVASSGKAAQPTVAARILIAEDQPDVSEALRLLLKTAGYQSVWANSPARVVAEIEQHVYDAVLLDLNYARDTTSGEEGLELIQRLRAIDATLPLVVMTAWSTVDLAVEAMRRGAGDFIQKPWDNSRLLTVLRAQIETGRHARQEDQLQRREREDYDEAKQIQRSLLPAEVPRIPGLEISADWLPARGVGGDYFDVLPFRNGKVGICIADVAGKGMSAALLMSNLQAAVRALSGEAVAPRVLCQKVNAVLCGNNLVGRFITFFYAVVDTGNRTITYCNAGHNHPILERRDCTVERLDAGGPVLGEFPEAAFEQGELVFTPGDRLLLFTDGVSESRNDAGDEFGEPRLVKLMAANRSIPAADLRRALVQAFHEFSERPFRDDATLLVVAAQ